MGGLKQNSNFAFIVKVRNYKNNLVIGIEGIVLISSSSLEL